MRKCFLTGWLIVALSLNGCEWIQRQFEEGPNGEKSNAATVQAAVRGLPYGGLIDLGIGLVGLFAGGGAVHHHHKRKQKKAKAATPPAA